MTREPDAPINLSVNDTISNAVVIGIYWQNAVETGGRPILDHRIWYDQGVGSWVILDYGITGFSYVTSVPLIAGVSYSFKIQSRNAVGFSGFSNTVSTIAAQTPDSPNTPYTAISGSNVIIGWQEPNNQGS